MGAEDFKKANVVLAEHAEENNAQGLLVDVIHFDFKVPSHVGDWRHEHIVPRYERAGVVKKAFIHGEGFVAPSTDAQYTESKQYGIRHFATEEEAMAWFQES